MFGKKILGENLQAGYLELNAAEDRGIRSISQIIPPFCKRVVNFDESKIILLDEADNMTSKCQYDINEMIKTFGRKTKFIFTCNDSRKIIEDIQSVCRIVRFKKLTDDQIKSYLEKICKKENIEYNDSGLSTICYISDGDMRKSINNLQLTSYSYGKISKQNVLKICKVPDPEDITKIINFCLDKKLSDADNELEYIIQQGYYYLDIVNGFIYVITKMEIDEKLRLALIEIINKTKIVVSTGLRSKLQLSAMLCRIIKKSYQDSKIKNESKIDQKIIQQTTKLATKKPKFNSKTSKKKIGKKNICTKVIQHGLDDFNKFLFFHTL